jgi:hypothetical protein
MCQVSFFNQSFDLVRKKFEKISDSLAFYFQSSLNTSVGVYELDFKILVDSLVLVLQDFLNQINSEPHVGFNQ